MLRLLLYCIAIERLPVAQQNTSLSVRNYESTAATARILGADPLLANLVVTMGQFAMPPPPQQQQQSSSSSSPSPFRKGAVLSLLRMGQSTLGWLAEGTSNWSGAIRRRALQHWMDRGNSLPLIFPAEDLHFRYRDGAVVVKKKGTNDDGRTSMVPDSASCNLLQIGSRIPHCWLALSPYYSSSSSSTLNKDSSSSRHTITAEDLNDIVYSSVQLSGLMDALLVESAGGGGEGGEGRSASSSSSSARPSEEVASSSSSVAAEVTRTPTCSLWVSGRYSSDAAAAVGEVNRQYFPHAFSVVAVERLLGGKSSATPPLVLPLLLDHSQLQGLLQNPRYSIPPSANDPIRRDQKRVAAAADNHSSSSSMMSRRRKHALQSSVVLDDDDDDDARVLRVVDISNRWHQLLHRYYHTTTTTTQALHPVSSSSSTDSNDRHIDDEMIAVVVRPDGHVAHIFALPSYHDHHDNEDVRRDMQRQLRAVAQALFLVSSMAQKMSP